MTKLKTSKSKSKRKPYEKVKGGKVVELPEAPHRLNRIQFIPNKSTYDKDYHPQSFIQFCREGRTRAYICAAWGVSERTLSDWFMKYDEMREAREVGFQAFKAYYEETAYEAITYPKLYSASMLQFFLKNKCGWTEDGGRNDHEDIDLGIELDIKAV